MTGSPQRHEAELRDRAYRAGHWRAETLWSSLSAKASAHPASTIRDDQGGVTLPALLDRALRLRSGLRSIGVAPGDPVMIQSRNSIDAVTAMLACFAGGHLCVPLPPIFSPAQLAAVARSSGATCFLALTEQHAEIAASMAQDAPSLRVLSGQDMAGPVDPGQVLPAQLVAPDEPALVLYSSGSTGSPKGVLHSGNSLRFSAETVARHHEMGPDDTMLVGMEHGFVGSTVLSVLLCLFSGASAVLMSRWNASQAIRAIQERRVTYTLLLSTHVVDMLRCPDLERSDVSSLRRGILAGLDHEQRKETMARLCPRPLPMYGMSESIGPTTCEATDPLDAILRTDGRAIAGTEILVRDETGQPAAPGVVGDLFLRGPNRCIGYMNAPELTGQTLGEDGFFRTGDRAVVDARGFFTFIGREKDIIRRGGVTIVPAEIEGWLRTHPHVADVSLVAVPDARLGERSCACIIPKGDMAVSLRALQDHLESQSVAKYQWPEFAVVVDDFPRTVSLKVRKPDLARIASAAVDALPAGQTTADLRGR
jgi:acyl-CoA synthetase (AMP-forming)/AMP-acid ligase II